MLLIATESVSNSSPLPRNGMRSVNFPAMIDCRCARSHRCAHELHAEEYSPQPRENYGYSFDPGKCLDDSNAGGANLTRVAADEQIDARRNDYAAPSTVTLWWLFFDCAAPGTLNRPSRNSWSSRLPSYLAVASSRIRIYPPGRSSPEYFPEPSRW